MKVFTIPACQAVLDKAFMAQERIIALTVDFVRLLPTLEPACLRRVDNLSTMRGAGGKERRQYNGSLLSG
jgi:hypothetical protein